MLNYHVKVGLVPIRRDVTPRPGIFNWEKAEERCAAAVAYIEEHFTSENVSFVDLKGINAVDVLYSDKDVDAVIERFQAEKVDAVFLINGNFGNEEVAGAVAKAIGKPVLLWGPQDTVFEADGTRYTDSQCGLFGMSRQLQRMNVPFTYIENCRIEDPIFTEGFLRFVGVACAVKNFKGMRVAQVGMRPKPFCSVIFNESDLMDKFDIHVIPVNLAVIQDKYNRILETRKDELAEGVAKLRQMYEIDDLSEPVLDKVYAFVLLYEEIFEEYNVAAVSAECWTAMQLMVGAMPCAAYPLLADMGYIIGCESDMHATLTQVVLKSLTLGQKKPFLGEFTTRHPSDRNVELLWPLCLFPEKAWYRREDGQHASVDAGGGRPFHRGAYRSGSRQLFHCRLRVRQRGRPLYLRLLYVGQVQGSARGGAQAHRRPLHSPYVRDRGQPDGFHPGILQVRTRSDL